MPESSSSYYDFLESWERVTHGIPTLVEQHASFDSLIARLEGRPQTSDDAVRAWLAQACPDGRWPLTVPHLSLPTRLRASILRLLRRLRPTLAPLTGSARSAQMLARPIQQA